VTVAAVGKSGEDAVRSVAKAYAVRQKASWRVSTRQDS